MHACMHYFNSLLQDMTADQCPSTTSTMSPDHHSSTTPNTTAFTLLPHSSTTPHTTASTPLPPSSTTPHTTTFTPLPHSLSTPPSHPNTSWSPHPSTSGSPHTNNSVKSAPSVVATDRSWTSIHARAGIILSVILLLCLVCGLASWLVYAYLNPHSKSGLWLIKVGLHRNLEHVS